MKASDKPKKKGRRNPFYRYVVELPQNYKPRKFDLNWVASEWAVSGHTRKVRIRRENADTLARTKGYRLVPNSDDGKYVKMIVPFEPTIAHRKAGKPSDGETFKTYI